MVKSTLEQILVEQNCKRLMNITWFDFRLTVHFYSLTMKTTICSILSLFFLVSENINEETQQNTKRLLKEFFSQGVSNSTRRKVC